MGLLLPVEGDRWMVGLAGAGRDYPPTDEAGFLEFAASLRSPIISDAIRHARPLSPIHGYRQTDNRWRHYEQAQRWPERLVVLGDAACTINPIYGAGAHHGRPGPASPSASVCRPTATASPR